MPGKVKSGILQLLTLGGLGLWSSIDLILIASKYEEKDTKNIKKKQFNFAIIACTLVLMLNICTLIIGLRNINDLKLNVLNITALPETISYNDYNDFIDDINLNKRMRVFMENEATDEEIRELKEDLSKIEGINSITFVSKEEAYNEAKGIVGTNDEIMEGITPDIFSVSYEITVEKLNKSDEVYSEIVLLDNVEEVNNDYEISKNYNNIKITINVSVIFTIILVAFNIVMLVLAIFIIKNNIKKKGENYNDLL